MQFPSFFWMIGQEFTYHTSGENHFWQKELSWQEYTNTGPYGVRSWDKRQKKGNKPDTRGSLFPFWTMNLKLPMLTQEVRPRSHRTHYTRGPMSLCPLCHIILWLILLCFSSSQRLTRKHISLRGTLKQHILSLHQLFLRLHLCSPILK